MSQYSVALWNKLPPITERSSCIHRAWDLKSNVSQNTMNVLRPVQTHLQPIEAKRAMLIFDDLVTKVLLVGAFPKIISNIETFALLVGNEATNMFKQIEPLAKELDEGVTPGSSLKILELTEIANKVDDPFFKEPKNRLLRVKDTVFMLSRNLIRSLMGNKEACFALLRHYQQWGVEACPPLKHMGSLLVQMRFLVRQALLTTTKEKTKREEYQNKTERRMRRQLRLIEEMTTDLSNQTEEHNKMVNKTKADIEEVRNALLRMENDARAKVAEMHEKFMREFKHTQLRHQSTMEMLEDDFNATKKQYDDLCKENRSQFFKMRKRKWMVDDEIDAKVKTSDSKRFDIQAKLDSVTAEYIKEHKLHSELKEKFAPIKKEYDEICEIRRKEEEQRRKEQEEKEEMIRAATFIQNFWRMWKTRKLLKQHKKVNIG